MGLLALAEAQLKSGNVRDALSAAREAIGGFGRYEQSDSERRAVIIAALASDLLRDSGGVLSFAERASSLSSKMASSWGSENYAEYVKRPDIEQYNALISKVVAVK